MDENNEDFDINESADEIAADMGLGLGDDFNEDEDIEDGLQEENSEAAKEVGKETEEPTVKEPPKSWGKDSHEIWSTLTPEAQAQIELREKQMLDGLEEYKHGHQFAGELMRAIEPFREEIHSHGLTEMQAIQNLMGTHRVLTQGPLEVRQQAFIDLGRQIGLIPNDGQTEIDPHTQELQQRLDRIERQEQQRQQQIYEQELTKVRSDVEAFASDPEHVYFDEVADDMIPLLKPGMTMDQLKSVYDKAVWANPVTRAKEQAKLISEKTSELAKKQKEEALAAKKATGANVRRSNANKTTSAPFGSWDETMDEVLARRENG